MNVYIMGEKKGRERSTQAIVKWVHFALVKLDTKFNFLSKHKAKKRKKARTRERENERKHEPYQTPIHNVVNTL